MADRAMVCGGDNTKKGTRKLITLSFDPPLDPMFPKCPPNSIFGSSGMVSFEAVGVSKSRYSIFCSSDHEEISDEFFDEYYNQLEKKSRLSVDQVQFLERSFEVDNKLEPDRKIQLAKELGVEPRQIAVWFQNRRVRCKTKQLEIDYDKLRATYSSLKNDYDDLLKENEMLKLEVLRLKDNMLARENKKGNSQQCDAEELSETLLSDIVSEDEEPKLWAVAFRNKEQSLARGNISDISGPRFSTLIDSSLIESGDLSHAFELDQSGFTPDNFCHSPANSCSFGFPIEDHDFSFWSF